MSDSVRPHRRQPTRLPGPWDYSGKNTGVGCHFLLQCMKVKVKVKSLSHVRLLATPWTAAHQAPRSMGFSRQKYWSGVPLPFLSCMLGMSKAESTAKVQGRRTQNMKTRLMMLWVKGETLGLSDTEFYKGRPSCPHLYAQVGSLTRRKLSRDREGRIVITRT